MRVRELRTNRVIIETLQNAAGQTLTSTIPELNLLDGVTATTAEINAAADLSAQAAMAPAAGFLGTGTVYKSAVTKEGEFIKTQIYIDLTGAKSTTTDLDIIGNTGVAYFGRVTAAINGAVVGGTVQCLEVPTTGADDIDFYAATAATGAYDADVSALAGAAVLVTAGEAWALGATKGMSSLPAANAYMYMACGEAGTVGTYAAGKFLITLYGV